MYITFLMPIGFGITALSEAVGSMFLGESFEEAYKVIPWVAWGAFFFGLTQYVYKPLELGKKTTTLLYLVIFAATLNVLLNLVFIPRFGALGAAYSTLVSYAGYLLATWLSSRRILIWSFPVASSLKALIASLVMYGGLFFIEFRYSPLASLALEILIGSITYFSVMYVLREEVIVQGFTHLTTRLRIRVHREG